MNRNVRYVLCHESLQLSLVQTNPTDWRAANDSSSVVLTDDTLSQSEYGVVVRLSVSRLQQVFLNVQWFRHSENRPTIGRFLFRLKFCDQRWHGETLLGVPVAAGSDDGVPADQGETVSSFKVCYLHQGCWRYEVVTRCACLSNNVLNYIFEWPAASKHNPLLRRRILWTRK